MMKKAAVAVALLALLAFASAQNADDARQLVRAASLGSIVEDQTPATTSATALLQLPGYLVASLHQIHLHVPCQPHHHATD